MRELPARVGKAAALNAGCALAEHEIIVFADIRQTWEADALLLLLENFADPSVGAVSGDLLLRDADGVLAGVALYWRYEKMLRRLEGRVWSVVGATGAISAVRRQLFCAIPPGTLLDDVYWPLCVALQGFRVIHDRRAIAYDRLPSRTRDEFRRKVRTLSGNFQLLDAAAGGTAARTQSDLAPVRFAQAAPSVGAVGPRRSFHRQCSAAGSTLPDDRRRPDCLLSAGSSGFVSGRGCAVAAGLGGRVVPGPQQRRLAGVLGLDVGQGRTELAQDRLFNAECRMPNAE